MCIFAVPVWFKCLASELDHSLYRIGSPLTKFQLIATYKRILFFLGCNTSDFGSHSFKIGVATEVAQLGLSDDTVKNIGS